MIKKLILLGFGLTLLIGLPLAIFVLQNQTQTQSGAAPVTKFSFTGPTTVTNGQNFDETITVDPGGTNQVSFVKFSFTYDPAFLDKQSTPVTIDTTKYTQLEAPAVNCTDTLCTVTGTISIGSNQSAVIKSATPIAVVHLTAKANTDSTGTKLNFVTGQNQALSVGNSDQAAENVFQSGTPATIIIGDQSSGGTTPSVSPTISVSPTDTQTQDNGGTPGGGTSGSNTVVSCSSFTADSTSGNAPLIVTFTSVGTSATDTIARLDITYGDGTSDTIASGSGIATGDVNNQVTHTYSNNGTFTAQAIFTTEGGATSDNSTCKQTISVGALAQAASPTPMQKLPPTGPGDNLLLIGVAGIALTIVGMLTVAGL